MPRLICMQVLLFGRAAFSGAARKFAAAVILAVKRVFARQFAAAQIAAPLFEVGVEPLYIFAFRKFFTYGVQHPRTFLRAYRERGGKVFEAAFFSFFSRARKPQLIAFKAPCAALGRVLKSRVGRLKLFGLVVAVQNFCPARLFNKTRLFTLAQKIFCIFDIRVVVKYR